MSAKLSFDQERLFANYIQATDPSISASSAVVANTALLSDIHQLLSYSNGKTKKLAGAVLSNDRLSMVEKLSALRVIESCNSTPFVPPLHTLIWQNARIVSLKNREMELRRKEREFAASILAHKIAKEKAPGNGDKNEEKEASSNSVAPGLTVGLPSTVRAPALSGALIPPSDPMDQWIDFFQILLFRTIAQTHLDF